MKQLKHGDIVTVYYQYPEQKTEDCVVDDVVRISNGVDVVSEIIVFPISFLLKSAFKTYSTSPGNNCMLLCTYKKDLQGMFYANIEVGSRVIGEVKVEVHDERYCTEGLRKIRKFCSEICIENCSEHCPLQRYRYNKLPEENEEIEIWDFVLVKGDRDSRPHLGKVMSYESNNSITVASIKGNGNVLKYPRSKLVLIKNIINRNIIRKYCWEKCALTEECIEKNLSCPLLDIFEEKKE